jgi:hypothetical protein
MAQVCCFIHHIMDQWVLGSIYTFYRLPLDGSALRGEWNVILSFSFFARDEISTGHLVVCYLVLEIRGGWARTN